MAAIVYEGRPKLFLVELLLQVFTDRAFCVSGDLLCSIEGMISLKVDNLTYRTTPEDLRRAFEKYGDVGDVYIPRDRFTRESRGFAFVRFYDKRDAEDAMDSMDGAILDGREVRCQMARYGRPAEPYRRGPPPRRFGRYR